MSDLSDRLAACGTPMVYGHVLKFDPDQWAALLEAVREQVEAMVAAFREELFKHDWQSTMGGCRCGWRQPTHAPIAIWYDNWKVHIRALPTPTDALTRVVEQAASERIYLPDKCPFCDAGEPHWHTLADLVAQRDKLQADLAAREAALQEALAGARATEASWWFSQWPDGEVPEHLHARRKELEAAAGAAK